MLTLGAPILFGWILMELLEVGLLKTIAIDMHGIYLDIIPGEAHWKLKVCENAMKGTKGLAMDDPEITPQMALSESSRTFNERDFVRGYIPFNMLQGVPQDRTFPAAIGDCPDLLVEKASGEMTKAFLEWPNDQRIQRATNSKARTVQKFERGDLVYAWRKQVSGQAAVKGGSLSFVGPACLLALEMTMSDDGTRKQGSSAWCARGRRLWKCCLEQLRHASSKELLSELQEESQDTWDFRHVVSAFGKNEYLDVSAEAPTEQEWNEGHGPKLTWHPMRRLRGKRASSPGVVEPMALDPPTVSSSSRAPRSRSPVARRPPVMLLM